MNETKNLGPFSVSFKSRHWQKSSKVLDFFDNYMYLYNSVFLGKQTLTTDARGHTSRSSCAELALLSAANDHVMSCDSELVSGSEGANESCDNVMSCDSELVSARGGANESCDNVTSCDSELVSAGGGANESCDNVTSCDNEVVSSARVAILFSGGIDSAVIAALADR